jgi:hypothetical protein
MKYFTEIKCPALRAWNQLHFALQLEESHGKDKHEFYLSKLSEAEKQNLMMIAARITVKGRDFVLKEVVNFNK